jgi:hypothetical protein
MSEEAAAASEAATHESTTPAATAEQTTIASGASEQATEAKPGGTIAGGADEVKTETKTEAKPEPTEAERWQAMREKIAKHASAGDEKAYKKELARLERISNVESLYGAYRDLEAKFSQGGLVKIPGKDAKPEEITAFAKQLGWTDKPEEMIGQIKLEDGMVIGDADKPMLTGFLAAVHGATTAQDFASKATAWYYKSQEEAAALQDEADDTFRRESERALKEEHGPSFARKTNAIASIFATAPGGADAKNPNSMFSRIMGGRTADGKLIGNDPTVVNWLIGLVNEVNPAATVVEDGNQSGVTIDTELAEIQKLRTTDRRKYFSEEVQARERELIEAKTKIQARA